MNKATQTFWTKLYKKQWHVKHKFDFLLGTGLLRLINPSFQNIPVDQLTKIEIALPYFTYHNNVNESSYV